MGPLLCAHFAQITRAFFAHKYILKVVNYY
nr:MAG TPA: hypothetical protein [Caudoviricetes sp.]